MASSSINKKSFGNEGENIASDFLARSGYTILDRNFRVGKLGEIDIIAREKDYICFIEVKTRSSVNYGVPSEAVNKRKQQSITRLASIYISRHKLYWHNIRFDVVEVIGNRNQEGVDVQSINLIRNAF
ncbi:MAG: YraN family protein [Clostridiales bacterium]|jgi:putative endonuclease|nr:YraN family protein [Eubacteriales bacterium]MDH7565114.1 YraN family protein [Clostridiales bacterium]